MNVSTTLRKVLESAQALVLEVQQLQVLARELDLALKLKQAQAHALETVLRQALDKTQALEQMIQHAGQNPVNQSEGVEALDIGQAWKEELQLVLVRVRELKLELEEVLDLSWALRINQYQDLVQQLLTKRQIVRQLVQDFEQELILTLKQQEEDPSALEITLDFPEDASPEQIREVVKQAALHADAIHRAHGGHGLQIDSIDIVDPVKKGSQLPRGPKR